jgi:hypothetical protein
MARTPLRPDIAAARTIAKLSPGSGRELTRLKEMLGADEVVDAMSQARYQGCFGLIVLTGTRMLFLCDGIIWKVSDDVPLDRIGLVQWQTAFGFGTLTVHAGGATLQFTGVTGPGGAAILRGIRAHLAEKDRLERQAREGIHALTSHFSPAPDDTLVSGTGVPAADPEFAVHI